MAVTAHRRRRRRTARTLAPTRPTSHTSRPRKKLSVESVAEREGPTEGRGVAVEITSEVVGGTGRLQEIGTEVLTERL